LVIGDLVLQKDTFVDADLQEHFSDLLYSIPLRLGETVYVYLLFEHKSYPDKWVAFQLLRYMVRIWDQQLHEDANRPLTPIIPLVVYHGRAKWTMGADFASLFTGPAALRAYWPDFQYQLSDLSAYNDEEIQGTIWLRVFLLILKHIFDERLGSQLPAILGLARELVQQETGLAMMATILRYVSQASSGVTKAELRLAITAVLPKDGGIEMATLAEQWIEQGRLEGIELGIEQGIERGLQAQRNTLLKLLQRRFQPTQSELDELTAQLAKIDQFDQLDELTDYALDAVMFVDFKRKLATYEVSKPA